MYALAKSQACIDGNKRIALLLTIGFVQMNGGRLELARGEIADAIEFVAASNAADREDVVVELTGWMNEHLRDADKGTA